MRRNALRMILTGMLISPNLLFPGSSADDSLKNRKGGSTMTETLHHEIEEPEDLIIPPDQPGAEQALQSRAPYTEMIWRKINRQPRPEIIFPRFRSRSVKEWEESERPAILKNYHDILYGKMPGRPDKVWCEVMAVRTDALNGSAIRKEIRVCFQNRGGPKHYLEMLLYIPKHVKAPVPVFVGLNFGGNQACAPETDIRQTRAHVPLPVAEGGNGISFARAAMRGTQTRENVEGAVRRGYAIATANYNEICPDHFNGLQVSVFSAIVPPEQLRSDYQVPFLEQKKWKREYSAIGAWAWGMSRMLDALEQEPLVDAGKAMCFGHSRLSYASLWCGATDKRFQIVFASCSGGGGTQPWRREPMKAKICFWEKGSWYAGELVHYIDDVSTLPFEQNYMIALIAPRHVYAHSAVEDLNADPEGSFLTLRNADPIWALYGKEGLKLDRMPEPGRSVGGHIGFHLRLGGHALLPEDWEMWYDYADRVFRKTDH